MPQHERQQHRPDSDSCVGKVERPEAPGRNLNVNEIRDASRRYEAVPEVAERAASCKRMLGSRSTVRMAFLVRQAEPQEGPYHRQQKKAKSDGPPPALPVDPDSPEGYARRVQERDGQTTGDMPRPDHLRAEPRGCRQDCDASDNPRLHEVP